MKSTKYFASQDSKDLGTAIFKKVDDWNNMLITTGMFDKVQRSWAMYHGIHFGDRQAHTTNFAGEQGELVELTVNHYRNIGEHLINMTVAVRPAMEARAVNSDYKSLTQTVLANGLLDYYMREKGLEEYLKTAITYAIVFGEGYIKMEWDVTAGDEYGVNPATGTVIKQGDIKYSNHSCLDIIRDITKEDNQKPEWLIVRSFRNRFDLIAQYPELEEQLLGLKTKSEVDRYRMSAFLADDTDDVPVYEFFHDRTAALPNGRYMFAASPEAIFIDQALPYRFIPVHKIVPSSILGTPFGYTPMFDLMPIQEVINSTYSTIATNHSAFGVQNVLMPKGGDINISSLGGGLNVIEYNPQLGKPEALNLTETPAEIFKMLEILERVMETISGVNSVTRGNPEASLKSGAALAMVQAQAVQFISGLQQSYVRMIENVGTGTIKMLQDFATTPRVAAIVGKANRVYLKEFSSTDLQSINRVVVDVANPLSRTTAGRAEMANNLIQMGLVTKPDDYFTIINTGSLAAMVEGDQAELLLIKSENERMVEKRPVRVTPLDNHKLHIMEHKALLADPDLRSDNELATIVLDHIQEHIADLSDPALAKVLLITNQQPLPPDQPAGPPPAPEQQGAPTGEEANAADQIAELATPIPVGPEGANINLPNMPNPPAPFETLPTNPANTNVGGSNPLS